MPLVAFEGGEMDGRVGQHELDEDACVIYPGGPEGGRRYRSTRETVETEQGTAKVVRLTFD